VNIRVNAQVPFSAWWPGRARRTTEFGQSGFRSPPSAREFRLLRIIRRTSCSGWNAISKAWFSISNRLNSINNQPGASRTQR
jgi:hypothetical protein